MIHYQSFFTVIFYHILTQGGYQSTTKQQDNFSLPIFYNTPLTTLVSLAGSTKDSNSFAGLKIANTTKTDFKATFSITNPNGNGLFFLSFGLGAI